MTSLPARRREGDAALEPRSRRPKTSPAAIPVATVELIVELRRRLAAAGLDAGSDTIGWHLEQHHHIRVSRATIDRTLRRQGLVVAAKHKRPRSSSIRFEAEQPNEMWQSDFTHYRLITGVDAEILTWLDDHSRHALAVTAHLRVTGTSVLDTFRDAVSRHGAPASTLTDNGMVFTTRLSGGKGGRNAFEAELRRLGIVQMNSRPNHPTTCGKVERFQQTLKAWLRAQPNQPSTIAELQALCNLFVTIYNLSDHTAPSQPAAPPPSPTPPGPKPAPVTAATTATTGSATTASPPAARSPCASTASCTTSASAEPTPEPASSCSSPTRTCASSTPPPARSSATSPSTPTAATTAPADHPDHHHNNDNGPTPHAGSGRPGCLETSQRADEGNRTPVFSLGS